MQQRGKYHHQILICGGGTAGIAIAAQLRRKLKPFDVGIVEPSDTRRLASSRPCYLWDVCAPWIRKMQ
jgi:2-polyprenyl-6-methoxyphenol hydroxylase-like FAD-dependent oxidoreductase